VKIKPKKGAFMKPVKMTLFITAAILASMILGTLKAQAAESACTKAGVELECEMQYFRDTGIVLGCLKQELEIYPKEYSTAENVQLLMSAMIKAEAFEGQARKYLTGYQCDKHLMNAELLNKGTHSSASDEMN
jgi:hypothetical protein